MANRQLSALRTAALSWARRAFILVLLFQSPNAPAQASPASISRLSQSAVVAATPVFAGGWSLNRLLSPLQSLLNSRARMIQFAAIGMCIGLYILLRR
jgi:hypothetical protein